MVLNYDTVVRSGIARQIADNIRDAIMNGDLKVDERLPTEDELAKRFGISRPTVREALKRLAAQNLIRSRRGPLGGNFVRRPDPEGLSKAITGAATLMVGMGAFDIDEIIAARQETESVCCRLACDRRTEEHLERMAAEIAVQRDKATSDEEFCASDVRFHRALVDATDNGPLQLMMYTVIEAFIPITNLIVFRIRERRQVVELHVGLLDAIRCRDSERAIALLSTLLAYLQENYAKAQRAREERKRTATA